MVTVVQKAQKKQCTCYQCKTVLEYEFTDMSFTTEGDYGGGRDRVARITCPVCQYRCSVSVIF